MASDEAIAIRKAQAQERIDVAAGKLAKALGFSAKDAALWPTHKDPAIQVAVHLEAIADFLEAAVDKAGKSASSGTSKTGASDGTASEADAALARAEATRLAEAEAKAKAEAKAEASHELQGTR